MVLGLLLGEPRMDQTASRAWVILDTMVNHLTYISSATDNLPAFFPFLKVSWVCDTP
jgi:hypothetical protein